MGARMNDLFSSIEEAKEEREAIMHESNVPNASALAAADMHRCEIKSVIRKYFPQGSLAAAYFDLVEQNRGKESADKLRDGTRAAWREQAELTKRRSAVDADKAVNK